MNNCCEKTVPQSDSSYKTFDRPVADWQARLRAGLNQSVQASEETLGHLEEQILQQTQGLERRLLEEAAQKESRPNAAGVPCLRAPLEPAHARA